MDFMPQEEATLNLTPSTTMEFEPVHEQPAKIKVIGVGGGGGNAVNHMFRQGIRGVDFIVCNTDAKALNASPVPNKIELGKLGAGNVPERARKAALEHKDEIREAISDDTQMLFITAGMGGGTGTGAAPVIAEIAKNIELDDEMVPHILVVAIVTMPFTFEGKVRRQQALAGIEELKKHVDAILVINNDKLRDLCGNLPFNMAFSQADDVLLTAAKGIAEIITVSGYVNIDFRDVNTVMENSGTALMGAGEGRGDDRARQAIESATTSVLLNDNDIRGAKNILLYFSYSPSHQITMDEIGEVTDYLTDLIGNNEANIIWGNSEDDNLNDELRITLIATGFEQRPGQTIHHLSIEKEDNKPQEQTPDAKAAAPESAAAKEEQAAAKSDEIRVVHINAEGEVVNEGKNEPVKKEDNDPFSIPQNGVKRVFTLEETAEEMPVEEVVMTAEKESVAASGNSYLDEIRIRPKMEAPAPVAESRKVETPNVNDIFDPIENKPTPQRTVFYDSPQATATTVETPVKTQTSYETPMAQQTNTVIDRQVERAFTPSSEDINDLRVRQKADRIRRMNDILHNHPEGAKIIESMTTEQLTNEPIFEAMHSSESDAARTIIHADGTMSKGSSFLTDLPD